MLVVGCVWSTASVDSQGFYGLLHGESVVCKDSSKLLRFAKHNTRCLVGVDRKCVVKRIPVK